jgi:hypothetical protein
MTGRAHQRRRAETFALTARNQQFTITLRFYPDNSLGAIFVGTGETGNDIQPVARDGAVPVHLALQHGVALGTIHHATTRGAAGKPALILGTVDRLHHNERIFQQNSGTGL